MDQQHTGPGIGRMEMIGEIRTMLPKLWEAERFELAKEIMGDIHPDNFSGVDDATVRRIWWELDLALKMD